jgi:NADH:ubiquinone oxidoreductase subunit C
MEDTQKTLDTADELLKPLGIPTNRPEDYRLDASVVPANLLEVVKRIKEAHWGYLSTITGLDHPEPESRESKDRQWRHIQDEAMLDDLESSGAIEILYHFCCGAAVLSLRLLVSYSHATIPTISNLFSSASLYEMELAEMFGVRIQGIPQEHLLLPEDWPKNVYPLRKSFHGLKESGRH